MDHTHDHIFHHTDKNENLLSSYYDNDFQHVVVVSPPSTPIVSPFAKSDSNYDVTDTASNNDSRRVATTINDIYSSYGKINNNITMIKANASPPPYYSFQQKYKSNDTLNMHNKHVCRFKFCGWSFKRYEHLKRHMLVHTGERPHKCRFPGCGKRFSRSDNFHAHYRTHTKKKNCATTNTKKKSAAVTTVSAAVTNSVTSTRNDSTTQFPYLANQQCQNFISSNNSIAGSVAAVAVSQQNQQSQVFYNSHLYFNGSTAKLEHDLISNGTYNMASLPTPIFNNRFKQFHYTTNNTISPSSSPLDNNLLLPSNTTPPLSTPSNDNQHSILMNATSPTTAFSISDNSLIFYAPNSSYIPTIDSLSRYLTNPKQLVLETRNNKAILSHNACPVSQCQRRFRRLEHLKRHMRIHALEKPFQCSYPGCKKNFSRSDNLSQHIKTHQRHLNK